MTGDLCAADFREMCIDTHRLEAEARLKSIVSWHIIHFLIQMPHNHSDRGQSAGTSTIVRNAQRHAGSKKGIGAVCASLRRRTIGSEQQLAYGPKDQPICRFVPGNQSELESTRNQDIIVIFRACEPQNAILESTPAWRGSWHSLCLSRKPGSSATHRFPPVGQRRLADNSFAGLPRSGRRSHPSDLRSWP
jgi:hypothetical protein